MALTAKRGRLLREALRQLVPGAPYADAEAIFDAASARKFAALPASIAIWLATITHIRHNHSEYDDLLAEGYDQAAARHFVIEQINTTLTAWRSTRLLEADGDEETE